jgi:hypothetical protein
MPVGGGCLPAACTGHMAENRYREKSQPAWIDGVRW